MCFRIKKRRIVHYVEFASFMCFRAGGEGWRREKGTGGRGWNSLSFVRMYGRIGTPRIESCFLFNFFSFFSFFSLFVFFYLSTPLVAGYILRATTAAVLL